MPGRSDDAPRAGDRFDALAKAAADGISRRRFIRLIGGLGLAAAVPWWARPALAEGPAPAAHAAIKQSGKCPAPPESETAPYYKGVCGLHDFLTVDKQGMVVGCKGDWVPVGLGMTSGFNGCGPEGGIDLPVLGKGDWVPDRPFGLTDFFDACTGHDCCYGSCTSAKSDCDRDFLQKMVATCKARYGSSDSALDYLRFGYCSAVAATYYAAVSHTDKGTEAYNAAKFPMCACCVTCEQYAAHEGVTNPGRYQYCGDAQNGDCTDTQTDNQNCGGCGTICRGEASTCCHGECHTAYECRQ